MLNITDHELVMSEIVRKIYSDISIAPLLGFKGGTALYMLYNLSRFSVDLDFDLLDESQKETVLAKIAKMLSKMGELSEAQEKHYTLFFLLNYKKGKRNLKIEISKRNLGSSYEVKNYLGTPILIMKKEDMFANKLAALLGRKELANRDIYDIWFIFSHIKVRLQGDTLFKNKLKD